MAKKHLLVQGATLKCIFSIEPKIDILKVKSHNKHFANDKDAERKLIGTTKEKGQTLEKNTFGKCKKQPSGNDYLPCHAIINEWSGFYEKITLSNQGKILLEDSKAMCPIGGKDCIEVVNHGQQVEISTSNVMSARTMLLNQINPLVDMGAFQNSLVCKPEVEK
jgi:hypothetical protein